MEQPFKIKNRLWICSADGTFLGEGRIELLKAIQKHGSISKAAQSMKMSYKKAWELVSSMNRQSPKPIVDCAIGGKEGGGSVVSEYGIHVISEFNRINDECQVFLNNKMKEIKL